MSAARRALPAARSARPRASQRHGLPSCTGATLDLDLHSAAAGIYLLAAVAATAGLAQRSTGAARASVWLLALAALVHGLAFYALHRREPTPSLTTLASAVSAAAFIATCACLAAQAFWRLRGLAVAVAPAAFLGAAYAAIALPAAGGAAGSGALWSHAHVLLASAGIALLGVAGAAGLLYLARHRRMKTKRALATRLPLPPLEALDRLNAVALAVGFLLLSLGVLTGVLWVEAREGRLWPGGPHATATLFAWAVYAALVVSRFGAGQGGPRSAWSALAGFALLLLAVLGVGLLP